MFRRRFPRLIGRGDFPKDKELTRKPRGHESGEFVNRVFEKTKAAPDHRAGAEWQKRASGSDERMPFWVEGEMKTNALLRFSPDGAQRCSKFLGSEPLLLLCWGNESSARRVSLTELSDAQLAKNP
jgi:hypothetical protein